MGDRGPGKGEHRMDRRGGPGGERRGMRHGMGLAMIGKMADTNGDGAISKDEFTTAALAMFDRADTNGDGTVTPDEREQMRGHMRGQHDGKQGDRHWGRQRGDAPGQSDT